MHWGNQLLWSLDDIGDFIRGGLATIFYGVRQLGFSILYNVWRLLAWVCSGIESVFRGLAGLNVDTNEPDMVQKIIEDDNVKKIFGNLIGLSMALIVFFTIVKIIQEHYKEKDGGNPYKIVIRTFKGLLMFFFVQAAVTVGLYASRVMFRALDSATSAGSTSLAGQVFRAMAENANRKRIGRFSEDDDGLLATAMNKYWARVADPQYVANDGKYMIVQVTEDTTTNSASPKSLREQYLEAFPSMRYGVVSRNGKSVMPLATWLSAQADGDSDSSGDKDFGDKIKDNIKNNGWNVNDYSFWNKGSVDGWDDDFWETGSSSATAGYENQFLKGLDLGVTPSISLNWSPIDIWTYGNVLKEAKKVEFDQNPTIMGTGVLIEMSLQFLAYGDKPVISPKSLEESAKVFGISINAGVALQDGKASASFSLDMFKPKDFADILTTVCVNVIYTNLAQKMIEFIPPLPLVFNVGPLSQNFIKLFAPVIIDMMKTCVDEVLGKFLPKDEETGKPKVEAMSTTASQTSSGVWLVINPKSQFLTTTIEQYKLDGNFTDLWSQLMDNFNQLMKDLGTSNEQSWDEAKAYQELLNQMGNNIESQGNWQAWRSGVDQYNGAAADAVNNLATYLALYEGAKAVDGDDAAKTNWLAQNMDGNVLYTFPQLKSAIKSTFTNIVGEYDKMFGQGTYDNYSGYPTKSYADPTITPAIYKPIVEFHLTEKAASSFEADDILQIMKYGKSDDKGGTIKVNMVIDDNNAVNDGIPAAYRIVDWARYSGLKAGYSLHLGKVADIFNDGDVPGDDEENAPILNNRLSKLAYMTFDPKSGSDYSSKGLEYFAQFPNGAFGKMSTKNGVLNDYHFEQNSYWGKEGIMVPGVKNDGPMYYYYVGTTQNEKNALKFAKDKINAIKEKHKADVETESVVADEVEVNVRLSSANMNTASAASQKSITDEISTMANVDTTTPLATEFSNHILTFRELYPAGDGDEEEEIPPEDPNAATGDKKVLDEWVSTSSSVTSRNGGKVEALYNWKAEDIDDYMSSTSTGNRRYLLLSKKNTVEPSLTGLGSYVGAFTFTDTSTVNALYDFYWMNYAVGFIAIITATGVYLNFAIGLIQRAVNMAVIYIMSPISIAFYPFDDGQRFNQNFVTAFYKEAISVYAVIISLNIFIVLLTPVKNAVTEFAGKAVGWLALVAFVSMLPKIRDQITSILGANPMSAQSFAKAIGDSKNAMLSPFTDIRDGVKNGILKPAAHRIDKHRAVRDRQKAKALTKRQEEIDKLQKLKAEGKLSDWGEKRLNKISKDARLASQARVDDALKTGKTDNLSRREKKRYDKLKNVANTQAKLDVGGKRQGESQKDYDARVAARQKELLDSTDFKNSVNGIVAGTRAGRYLGNKAHLAANWVANSKAGQAVGAVGSGIASGAGYVGGKIADGASWVANSKAGQIAGVVGGKIADGAVAAAHGAAVAGAAVGRFTANKARSFAQFSQHVGENIANSYLGEAFQAKFGLDGELTQDKDSVWGALNRMRDKQIRSNAQKRIAAKYRERKALENEYGDIMVDALAMNTQKYAEADKISNERVKKKVADSIVANSGRSATDKLEDLLVAEHIKGGKGRDDAKKAAAAAMAEMKKDGKSFGTEYLKRGGDETYAAGLAGGLAEFKDLGIKADFTKMNKEMAAAEKEIRAKGGNAKTIQSLLDTQNANKKIRVQDYAARIANQMNLANDAGAKSKIASILSKADRNTSYDDIVDNFASTLGVDKKLAGQALAANYQGFSSEVQFNSELQDLQAALDAQKARDKGDEMFASKIGTGVPKEASAEMLRVFKNVNDNNINSTNPDSLGYKTREIIDRYRESGGLSNPLCQAEVNDLNSRMNGEMQVYLDRFGKNHGDAIREFDIAQKLKQEVQAGPTVKVMAAYQNQREHYISTQMDPSVYLKLVNDPHYQEMRDKGDYMTHGLELQQLVDHVKAHEWFSAEELGYGSEFIGYLKNLEAQGKFKQLDAIRGLGEFDAAHMGTLMDTMGGSSLASQKEGFNILTQIAEDQTTLAQYDAAIGTAKEQEARSRAAVNHVLQSVGSLLAGKEWEPLYGKITDLQDKPVTNKDELAAAVTSMIEAVNNRTYQASDDLIQKNMQILTDFKSEYQGPLINSIDNTIRMIQEQGMANATLANQSEDERFIYQDAKSTLEGKNREKVSKINKDLLKGK